MKLFYLQKEDLVVTGYSRNGITTNPISMLDTTALFVTNSIEMSVVAKKLYKSYHTSSGDVSSANCKHIYNELLNDYVFIEYTDDIKQARIKANSYENLRQFQFQTLSQLNNTLSGTDIHKSNLHMIKRIKSSCDRILEDTKE